METLVEHRNIQIKVQDTNGYTVCIKCRGGKTRAYYQYYNPNAWRTGGLLSVVGQQYCPHCDGKGFWK